MLNLSPEALQEWLAHPVTQAFKAHLHSLREQRKEEWANDAFSQDTEFKNAVIQAKYIGQCEILGSLLPDFTDADVISNPQPQES